MFYFIIKSYGKIYRGIFFIFVNEERIYKGVLNFGDLEVVFIVIIKC